MKLKFNAIIFDLGGVILNIDYHKTILAFKNIGISNFDELYTQAKQNNIFDDFETGIISDDEFRNYIRKVSASNLTNDQIDLAWNAMLLDLPVERIELLNRLSKNYPIYLYSNTNSIHLKAFRQIIKNQHGNELILESLFLKTYYSHELGMRKPNQNGFLKIINDNELDIKSTLFVDDSEQHIIGASVVGLKTVWLKDKTIEELFQQY
jgi:putative hydrolase of the HAD superfamily